MRSVVIALLLIAARGGVCQDAAPASGHLKKSPSPSAPVVLNPAPPEWVPLSSKELVGTYFVGGFGTKYSLKLKEDGTFEQIEFPSFVAWRRQSGRESAPPVLYGQYGVRHDTLWLEYKYKVGDVGPDEQNADEPKPDEQRPPKGNQRQAMYAGMGFVPVRWDGRLYLLTTRSPDNIQREVAFFCHKLYFGEIPLGPAPDEKRPPFYLRAGDENKTVSGLPLLPKEWQGYLLTQPIAGKVIAFINGGEIIPNIDNPAFSDVSCAKVTLNIGAAEGVKWDLWFTDNKEDVFFPESIKEHSTVLINLDERKIDDLMGLELSTHPIHSSKP